MSMAAMPETTNAVNTIAARPRRNACRLDMPLTRACALNLSSAAIFHSISAIRFLPNQRCGNDLLPVGVNLVPLRLRSLDGYFANLGRLFWRVAVL